MLLKKILPILFCATTCLPAVAQVGIGVELGVGLSGMKFAPPMIPIPYTSAAVSPLLSGRLGAFIDVPLNEHISFQAGLYASRKGAVRDFSYHISDSFNEAVHQSLSLIYAELPLAVLYKTGKQGEGRFVAGLGGTPSYIIGGTSRITDDIVFGGIADHVTDKQKVKVNTTVKGFDAGLTFTAGYEWPTGMLLRAYYISGISDIGMATEISKNRMGGISIGYIFGEGRNSNDKGLIDNDIPK